jgi:hypothetical protein
MEHSKSNQTVEISQTVDEIVNGVNSGNTVIFCGAGISRNSGLPTSNQIISTISEGLPIHILNYRHIARDDYPLTSETLIQILNESSGVDEILNIYNQGEPNTNHILLAKLLKAGKVKTIVTTNYDKLIEKALRLEPKGMIEGEDYDVILKEQDLEKIDWLKDRIRIIKLNGTIEDKKELMSNISQLAKRVISKSKERIIERVFFTGDHTFVLILGCSSLDIFHKSLQAKEFEENHKHVYFIEHSQNSKVEQLREQVEKNPFQKFTKGDRLFINTDQIIKNIWESIIDKNEPYKLMSGKVYWKEEVVKWCKKVISERSLNIPIFISGKVGLN